MSFTEFAILAAILFLIGLVSDRVTNRLDKILVELRKINEQRRS